MDTENGILDAAEALLETHGPAGLTTRAVCEAAGIKAPTLYHYFGDKSGLERALIQRGLDEFMQRKRAPHASADPLEQLRFGWDIALEFALKRPTLYALIAQHALTQPTLIADAHALMQARVQRLVDLGRFQGPTEDAARAVWAASQGVLSLVLQGTQRKLIEATSDLLFKAVTSALSASAK
ncbi:TetR/AcrR family transcriptional regulator [Rhodoferax sp. TS-BS-61-7]|jgi:AcrR family transcriptional regulator|uniref:TetR/AcrR family transcriptional regulator n=1 Tax=Rhodoferax sp. TS-BS-61-7 TaxID=2094194 RepID=UPI000CF72B5D|nr:TetR/AcrR family transcriptional regulator [Rhodoferax sp. TS-BS-61-7]PQA78666.1 hypothetical protein C5F53_01415 [Rhodoferax sp. TS-BS-61-7]